MVQGSTLSPLLSVKNDGKVGIGNDAPGATLDIGSGGNIKGGDVLFDRYRDRANALHMGFEQGLYTYFSNYNVGIGTTTPSAQLHTTGTLRHANFGAGAATFDANGNVSSVSDERLKIIVGTFTAGLSELMGITPILHKYNELSGLDTVNTYAGFSAQNVMQNIPEAIGQDPRGYYSLSDRPIIAALVNAVKELQKEIDALKGKTAMAITEYKIVPIVSKDRLIKSQPLPSPEPVVTPTP